MLLLGAVAMFEPVNGYQIRRELVSWRIEDWANIKPGSIYNGLATLTKTGSLTRHDIVDEGRPVAVYQITDAGHEHHHDLVSEALTTPEVYSSIAFQSAFTQAGLLDRQDVLAALRKRLNGLEDAIRQFPLIHEEKSPHAPPIVMHAIGLWADQAAAETNWLQDTISRIETGAFSFRGEEPDWVTPADDPGWQMEDDRKRYRRLLAGNH